MEWDGKGRIMCMLCDVEAENLGLVLPGWYLVRSRIGKDEWPQGHWGLVRSNEPDFVWASTPTPDPLHGVPDDQWEAWIDANRGTPAYDRAMDTAPDDFVAALICGPGIGWELVNASIPFGYDPEESGDFGQWLFSLMGMRLRDGFLPEPERPEYHSAQDAVPTDEKTS